MRIDFTQVSDEPMEFELLPEGKYVLLVSDVKENISSKGNLYWAITFFTEDRKKVFYNLTFTEKTYNQVKKMFKNLGLDVNGTFDYQPHDLLGTFMYASVLIEDYTDKNGVNKQKNTIDLWNSESLSDDDSEELIKSEEIPF